MSEDLKTQLEAAQETIDRLDRQRLKVQAESEELGTEIGIGLLLGSDKVEDLIQRQVVLKNLAPAINGALAKAREAVTELQQEAQRQQLADMEQEYASLGNELEDSRAGLAQYQTVLMPTPGGRLDTNLQPDQKAAMKVKQDAQQALAGKLETMRRRIDHMKQEVGV